MGAEVIKVEPVTGDSLRRRAMGAGGKPLPSDLIHCGRAPEPGQDTASLLVELCYDSARVARRARRRDRGERRCEGHSLNAVVMAARKRRSGHG